MIGESLRESHEYHNDHVEHLRTTRKGLEALGSSAQLEFSHACRPPSGPSGKGVAKSALVTSVVLTPRVTVPWYVLYILRTVPATCQRRWLPALAQLALSAPLRADTGCGGFTLEIRRAQRRGRAADCGNNGLVLYVLHIQYRSPT
jgi:hypothetical protein